ncbi:hypothetical protein C8T65DRAFT_746047 [Cerioporus squamosus]|nr:hypothetical protein C8T65DRAFT_746047 [Cerioporus squamosus]
MFDQHSSFVSLYYPVTAPCASESPDNTKHVVLLPDVSVCDPPKEYRCNLRATLTRVVRIKHGSLPVYQADIILISPDGQPLERSRTAVVCKHAQGETAVKFLQREARIYQRLKHIQGEGIPKVIGYYTGASPQLPGGLPDPCAALVMEDCGQRLLVAISDTPLILVGKIMMKIHQAGVWYGDFTTTNIVAVLRHGRAVPTIVDFGDANTYHKQCRWEYSADGEDIPPADEHDGYHCNELRDIWNDLELWNPAYLKIDDRFYPADVADTPEKLLRAAEVQRKDVNAPMSLITALDAMQSMKERIRRRRCWEEAERERTTAPSGSEA